MTAIDLRSDTVTIPTRKMREEMARADVGDDVFGEDPTVTRLEEMAAEKVGKEAAVFVPSGTMGNLLALLSHTRPGQEVVLEANSHIYNYEVGGLGAVAGLTPRLISARDGIIDPDDVRRVVRPKNIHFPTPSLLCIENTHNMAGGVVTSVERMAELAEVARQLELATHLDGARVFNAATYLKVPVIEITKHVDSVMFCLSKGLAAPVGSMLAGSREFIGRARKFRKRLGGGMRQAGILAAAGIVALEEMSLRLHEDHANARLLARGMNGIRGIEVNLDLVQTNIVMVNVGKTGMTAQEFVDRLGKKGILALPRSREEIRFVTHYQVSRSDIEQTISAAEEIVRQAA